MEGTTTAPQSARSSIVIEQKATTGEFWGLGFKNWLLNIVTLTIYRFWAKTNTRRRLWATTHVNDDPLEYTGTGMELFKGFLIAILLFLPFGIAIYASQLFLPPTGAGIVIILIYLVLFWLIGVAIFLARRYQMSRTVWRGVRFAQHGSPVAFGWASFGYTLMSIITVGWFSPAAQMRLSRQLWSQTKFGDMDFRWERPAGDAGQPLYRSFAFAWFAFVLGYAALLAAVPLMVFAAGAPPEGLQNGLMAAMPLITAGAGLLLIAGLIGFVWHGVVLMRCEAQSVKLDGVSFELDARTWSYFWLVVTNALLMVLTLGIATPVAQLRVVRYLVSRLTVDGSIDLAAVRQSALRGPNQGEGIADGLDLSGVDMGL